MQLNQIRLENFRNYADAQVNLAPGLNLFLGQNGQGKTNLLEAIQYLTMGRTFRPGTRSEVIRREATWARVEGSVEKSVGTFRVGLALTQERRIWTVNDKKLTAFAMERYFPSVVFSPESLSIIKGGPEGRRDLIDETLSSYSELYGKSLEEFTKVLRLRNRVLRDASLQKMPEAQARDILAGVDERFLASAVDLTLARVEVMRHLRPRFCDMVHTILGGPKDASDLNYEVSDHLVRDWRADQIQSLLRERYLQLRDREWLVGYSLVGPHKHDIRFFFQGNDARFWCSQGQQRALILAFKLARIVYHYEAHRHFPFLLLDDVLSELDEEKRGNLVAILSRMSGQIFITSTEATTGFESDGGAVFDVRAGEIRGR